MNSSPLTPAFENKSVVVTGADGGIGAEIARQFAAAGAFVYLTGVRSGEGHALADSLGSRAVYETLDVTLEEDWIRVLSKVCAQRGRLDVLVNNAGYLMPGLSIEDTSLSEWQRHFAVNADGTFIGCRQAILLMRDSGGGAIVNVASAVAVRVHAESPAYCVSKAAVVALTRVVAMHCGQRKYGIRVNAVLPGPVDTAMMRRNVSSDEDFNRLEAMLIRKYPMERIGQPADVAHAVLFLASPQSAYVHGVAFAVDGGQSI